MQDRPKDNLQSYPESGVQQDSASEYRRAFGANVEELSKVFIRYLYQLNVYQNNLYILKTYTCVIGKCLANRRRKARGLFGGNSRGCAIFASYGFSRAQNNRGSIRKRRECLCPIGSRKRDDGNTSGSSALRDVVQTTVAYQKVSLLIIVVINYNIIKINTYLMPLIYVISMYFNNMQ